jgi:fumarate reductase iron-sulfur subunit
MGEITIKTRVFRCTPQNGKQEGHYESYEVPFQEGMSVLEVLDYIYKNHDSSLSFYYSCRIGKCLGCFVDIDGKVALACATPAKDNMTIGPHKKFNLIKDLMVDFS